GANDTIGEYFLQVTGHTGDLPALAVAGTDLADGAVFPTAPRELTLDFNDPFRFDTLEAADLTVDGVPATKVTIVDVDTVIFDLPGLHHHRKPARAFGSPRTIPFSYGTGRPFLIPRDFLTRFSMLFHNGDVLFLH
ncbi:MAG: hypothetical protein JXB62_17065, partial [Pirellulales bacterium]|nr:hypothetical protein [Pirellulales bacterium]